MYIRSRNEIVKEFKAGYLRSDDPQLVQAPSLVAE